MPTLKAFVSDKKESRDYHVNKRIREMRDWNNGAVTLVTPGAPGLDLKPINLDADKRVYIKEFSYENLMKLTDQNVIIEDVHKLSHESIENILRFQKDSICNVYLFSKKHTGNGGIYSVLNYLADRGCMPEDLEDFAIEQTPALKKAVDIPAPVPARTPARVPASPGKDLIKVCREYIKFATDLEKRIAQMNLEKCK